jgi:hypothetical protein
LYGALRTREQASKLTALKLALTPVWGVIIVEKLARRR